ncbi:hypothetical protein ID866_12045 [Astraeus odoratus]|nr:hypothetical protein ID866_12045 [Astraeus odoratus]
MRGRNQNYLIPLVPEDCLSLGAFLTSIFNNSI